MPRPKRIRADAQQRADAAADHQGDDLTHSVLGGMRGGFRISGDSQVPEVDNDMVDEQTSTFHVPHDDKFIVCQEWQAQATGQESNKSLKPAARLPKLIFTHGAGGGLANPATTHFAAGFAEVAAPVICFQGTMNLQSRVRSFEAVISNMASKHKHTISSEYIALGGRSMGARAAVLAANGDRENHSKALVLVSYPLLGGKQGTDMRDQILYELSADIDVLFVVGAQDKMCPMERLREVTLKMKAKTWLLEVEGADHGMSAKPKQAVEGLRKASGRVAASWVKARDRQFTECRLSWDNDAQSTIAGDWGSSESNQAELVEVAPAKDAGRKREAQPPLETRSGKRHKRKP